MPENFFLTAQLLLHCLYIYFYTVFYAIEFTVKLKLNNEQIRHRLVH